MGTIIIWFQLCYCSEFYFQCCWFPGTSMYYNKAGQDKASVNQINSSKNIWLKSCQRGWQFYTARFPFWFDRQQRNEVKQQSTAGGLQPPPATGCVGTWCGGGLNQAAMISSLNPSAWKEQCWETKSTWRPLGTWGSLHLTCTSSSLTDQVIFMKPVHILYISITYSLHFLNTSVYANYICGLVWIWVGVPRGSLVVVWEHPIP